MGCSRYAALFGLSLSAICGQAFVHIQSPVAVGHVTNKPSRLMQASPPSSRTKRRTARGRVFASHESYDDSMLSSVKHMTRSAFCAVTSEKLWETRSAQVAASSVAVGALAAFFHPEIASAADTFGKFRALRDQCYPGLSTLAAMHWTMHQ